MVRIINLFSDSIFSVSAEEWQTPGSLPKSEPFPIIRDPEILAEAIPGISPVIDRLVDTYMKVIADHSHNVSILDFRRCPDIDFSDSGLVMQMYYKWQSNKNKKAYWSLNLLWNGLLQTCASFNLSSSVLWRIIFIHFSLHFQLKIIYGLFVGFSQFGAYHLNVEVNLLSLANFKGSLHKLLF